MWTASARAKINLHLAVHARRPDGFHALTTVFQTIALADTLTIVEHDGPFTLRCPGSDAPEDDSNLVVRAARALASELGRPEPTGLDVTLDKQVPTQAGLGGGSADAMAALRLLCEAWGVPADRDLLARVGGRLGSDVPFFAWGGTALGHGPRRRDRAAAAAAAPGVRHRPPAVRRRHRGRLSLGGGVARRTARRPRRRSIRRRTPASGSTRLAGCRNDFEPVVAARHPDIAERGRRRCARPARGWR